MRSKNVLKEVTEWLCAVCFIAIGRVRSDTGMIKNIYILSCHSLCYPKHAGQKVIYS